MANNNESIAKFSQTATAKKPEKFDSKKQES